VLSGACDDLPEVPAAAYPFAHEQWLARHAGTSSPPIPPRGTAELEPLGTYRRLVRVFQEIRLFGMHPSGHPMEVLRREAMRAECLTSAEIQSMPGRLARFAGIVAATRRVAVRAGIVQFITFEDEHGLLETVLPPHVYARLGDPIRNPGPFLLTGQGSGEAGEVRLILSRALPFHLRARPYDSEAQGSAAPVLSAAPPRESGSGPSGRLGAQ